MKLSSQKRRRDKMVVLQMTSMIDVVFLLLIFFLVTSAFVRTERDLDTAIKSNQRAARNVSDLEPAVVYVESSDGRFVYRIGSRKLTDYTKLTNVLQQLSNKADGAFVRVADDAPFQMAAEAIQACKSAGFTAVSYVPMDK